MKDVITVRKLTIKDVAKEAGVSTATISRVLSGTGYVSEEVRKHVLATVNALNYQPNAIARSLKQEKSWGVGMIIPDMTNSYFMSIARTMQKRLVAEGYRLLFMDSEENPEKEREALDSLRSNRVEAIVLAGTGANTELLQQLASSDFPLVLLDRSIRGVNADLVMEDNRTPVREAIASLMRQGHRRIGVLAGPETISTARERSEAVREAFAEAGQTLRPGDLFAGDFTRESGKLAARHWLAMDDPPTAVFSANNEMTFGLYLGLKELGIEPDEIEVASFGDLEFSSLFRHRLSVVSQSPSTIGEAAADMVLRRLHAPDSARESRIFAPRFIARA